MDQEEINPIFTNIPKKRNYLMSVEKLLRHVTTYLKTVPDVAKKLSNIQLMYEGWLGKDSSVKNQITQTSALNAGIKAFNSFHACITDIPYNPNWIYEENFIMDFGKSGQINYVFIYDLLLPQLEKEAKKNFELGFQKNVISIFKLLAWNHGDEDTLIVCDKIIEDLSIELGLIQPRDGDDPSNPANMINRMLGNFNMQEVAGRLSQNPGIKKYVQRFQDGEISDVNGVFSAVNEMMGDEDIRKDVMDNTPKELSEGYSEIMKNFRTQDSAEKEEKKGEN